MKTESKNIFSSVSAGYSSIMMALKLREWFPDHNIINVMANTSKEHIKSLMFMNECDRYFGLNLIWIEADIRVGEIGNGYVVKTFDEILLNGEIYEKGIQKYGIASNVNKWCNKDLKYRPMQKFADDIFGKNDYSALRSAKKRLRMYANLFNRDMRKVLINHNSSCIKCGSNSDLQIDHIIPIEKGGKNELGNVQILCWNCNRQKSNK